MSIFNANTYKKICIACEYSFHNYPKAEKLNVTQLNKLQIISIKTVNEKGKNTDLTRYLSNRFV